MAQRAQVGGVKLGRLIQPRKPAFWLMLVLNALSMVLVWLMQNYTLSPLASVVLALFALGNAGFGAYFTWQLLRAP